MTMHAEFMHKISFYVPNNNKLEQYCIFILEP